MEEKQTRKTGFRENRKCVDCGKEFIAKNPRSVRCHECRIVYHREHQREYEQKKRELTAKTSDDLNICKKIKSCYYGGKMGAEHTCDYLAITGTRRPCKAGECYFYKKKGKAK